MAGITAETMNRSGGEPKGPNEEVEVIFLAVGR
jgi:hypothetical protein